MPWSFPTYHVWLAFRYIIIKYNKRVHSDSVEPIWTSPILFNLYDHLKAFGDRLVPLTMNCEGLAETQKPWRRGWVSLDFGTQQPNHQQLTHHGKWTNASTGRLEVRDFPCRMAFSINSTGQVRGPAKWSWPCHGLDVDLESLGDFFGQSGDDFQYVSCDSDICLFKIIFFLHYMYACIYLHERNKWFMYSRCSLTCYI